MDLRAAELTADHLGRTMRIDPGDQTVLVGRLVSMRHKGVVALREFSGLRLGFNAIGVVELL
jgi:hypothetical protein